MLSEIKVVLRYISVLENPRKSFTGVEKVRKLKCL